MKKTPEPVDKHVGSRVRARRMMMGMGLKELADALGLSFQQLQKYEKGTNRVSASRLQQIATALKAPISFFFEGLTSPGNDRAADASAALVDEFMSTSDGIDLAKAFAAIRRPDVRRSIVALVGQIAGEP